MPNNEVRYFDICLQKYSKSDEPDEVTTPMEEPEDMEDFVPRKRTKLDCGDLLPLSDDEESPTMKRQNDNIFIDSSKPNNI
ncbi:hypothetical protein BGZ76_005280, partial [Entomortierella beljakovae]